jgi:GTP-binding protein LepA
MPEIRNFSIVAHVDHGKSTLADRLIERAKLVEARDMRDQLLDTLDIERERGITIKSNTVTLPYTTKDGREFALNLIDTPGHVDFSYEVSRALGACEGVLLLVDAGQGVEAQTLAHLYSAMELDLAIVPVINKIDLPAADIERCRNEIDSELGIDPDEALLVSGKTGQGVDELLEAICLRLPPPRGNPDAPLRALVFDAHYDAFRGTIVQLRIVDGCLRQGDAVRFLHTQARHEAQEVGIFRMKRVPRDQLVAGEVGYIISGIKAVADVKIGDTLSLDADVTPEPLPGFKEVKPVVFASLYPMAADDYLSLAEALDRYKLNDGSLVTQKDSSAALGQGFRCGFLGLLHLEIVQERLEREFDQALLMTLPSVRYRFTLKNGTVVEVENPAQYPDPSQIDTAEEPYIRATIRLPERHLGTVMALCLDRRGTNTDFHFPAPGRIELRADLPLSEVIYDFYDKLKSVTQGYGSFDYEPLEYREADLVKLDILVNGDPVDALASMVHKQRSRERAVQICDRLQEEIPRQMFKIAIQGAIGGHIIARSTVNPFRKDVTAKCYGGDISRKRKLLEKQKEGKKRMKLIGAVEIPQSAFVAVLRAHGDEKK